MAHFNFFKLERRIIFLISSLLILYLMMYINSSNASTLYLYTHSSSSYLSPSFTIFSISSICVGYHQFLCHRSIISQP
ncbi:hypothetical protein HanXRQr2_Chr03g0122731 [Helianthus annuus]|uniref:Uncharacterized protein n=1 Tax=Helianthus annuus TaxID=4232 RepID=A0A9K3JHS6_HELAN|nr:hypothetical protein HanXRQr2_Chr03g0122731 [Helianthus annuus]